MKDLPPRRQLHSHANDTRTVGVIFAVVGLLPLIIALTQRGMFGLAGQILAGLDTLILVGPGVWYIVASAQIRKLNRRAVTISIVAARAQLIVVGLTLVAAGVWDSREVGIHPRVLMIPALLALFFIPALIALMLVLRKARALMNLIEPEAHGFEPLAVLPVEEPQSTDSLREK